jgi:glycosyltransferase involved in cell wall biosynthesis
MNATSVIRVSPFQLEGIAPQPMVVRVTTCGKVTDTSNFGGAPYFFSKALADLGVTVEPQDLVHTRDLRARHLLWAAREVIAGRGPRGFMFSNDFLEAAWAKAPEIRSGECIINLHQVFPESVIARAEAGDITLVSYVDLCLHELLREWRPAAGVTEMSVAHYRRAIDLERRGYLAAHSIVTFSRRTADILKTRYAIDPRKMGTIAPGANLDEDVVETAMQVSPSDQGDFVVGYVGIDHRRKGLTKLAAAVLAARNAGAPISLRVIGPRPPELENTPGVELLGRVDKFTDMKRFIRLIAECQLGALLSLAEGLPCSLLEFLRVGVPIMGTNVNGIPDILKPEFGILVEPSTPVEELAAILQRLASGGADYTRLRNRAWEIRQQASWRRAVDELRSSLQL